MPAYQQGDYHSGDGQFVPVPVIHFYRCVPDSLSVFFHLRYCFFALSDIITLVPDMQDLS
jgi:hypothetical protein